MKAYRIEYTVNGQREVSGLFKTFKHAQKTLPAYIAKYGNGRVIVVEEQY